MGAGPVIYGNLAPLEAAFAGPPILGNQASLPMKFAGPVIVGELTALPPIVSTGGLQRSRRRHRNRRFAQFTSLKDQDL